MLRLLRALGPSPELGELRERLERERRQGASASLLLAAQRVQAIKLELGRFAGDARACATCAVGCAGSAGRFDGGYCCSGPTANVFDDEEIAVLACAGTSTRQLRASGAAAGCAFRGARGCTLPIDHRPSVCVHYACRDLMAELGQQGRARAVAALQDRLLEAMREFRECFGHERQERELADLIASADEPPLEARSSRP